MALPSSGPISMSMIMTELKNSGSSGVLNNTRLYYIGQVAGGPREEGYTPINQNSTYRPTASNPVSMSEWYSYNHSQTGSCDPTFTASVDTNYKYYAIGISGGGSGSYSDIYISMNGYTASTGPRIELHSGYPFNSTGGLTTTHLLYGYTFTAGGVPSSYPYTWNITQSNPILHVVVWATGVFWSGPPVGP